MAPIKRRSSPCRVDCYNVQHDGDIVQKTVDGDIRDVH